MITQKRLKELLRYDPETGQFTRLITVNYRFKVGTVAGTMVAPGKRRKAAISIMVDGRSYLAARLAWFYMKGEWPPEVDHKNLDTLDNRWENLRAATREQNEANKGPYRNNKLGIKGVFFSKGKYITAIYRNGRKRFLGTFDSPDEAASVYAAAVQKADGEFARVSC